MQNNTKFNQEIISEKETNTDNLRLTYTLFQSKHKRSGRHIYSVGISVSDGDCVDSNFVYDITRLKTKAESIFKLLYENTVTPCTLNDVLEDIL